MLVNRQTFTQELKSSIDRKKRQLQKFYNFEDWHKEIHYLREPMKLGRLEQNSQKLILQNNVSIETMYLLNQYQLKRQECGELS